MNHPKYAHRLCLYLEDINVLPDDIKQNLRRGILFVKTVTRKYNGVGCDLALEQSQNRSSAVSGGLIGIT